MNGEGKKRTQQDVWEREGQNQFLAVESTASGKSQMHAVCHCGKPLLLPQIPILSEMCRVSQISRERNRSYNKKVREKHE